MSTLHYSCVMVQGTALYVSDVRIYHRDARYDVWISSSLTPASQGLIRNRCGTVPTPLALEKCRWNDSLTTFSASHTPRKHTERNDARDSVGECYGYFRQITSSFIYNFLNEVQSARKPCQQEVYRRRKPITINTWSHFASSLSNQTWLLSRMFGYL